MIEGLRRAIEILEKEDLHNYEEELLMEDLLMNLNHELHYHESKTLKPTQKQLDFIEIMESYLYPYYFYDDEVLFRGTTKAEARKWISNNIEDFKRIQLENGSMDIICLEDLWGDTEL